MVIDVVILALMGVLVVFFAGVAALDWWDARSDHRADAQVIQHPQRDTRINPAA